MANEPARKQTLDERRPAGEEEIRRRAYELYEARGREEGHATEDWLQAEAELSRKQVRGVAA